MTIDEAIEHCKEVMENKNKTLLKYFDRLTYDSIENCNKCIDEHMQLMKWLEELKELRKQKDKFDENIKFFNDINLKCHNQGYNKAIDDFIKKLEEHEHKNWVDHLEYGITWSDIEQIANELKEHKTLNIVHCKDCKHWGTGVAGETKNIKCCEYGKYMVGANGYCVYGEKECAEWKQL